MNKKNLTFIRLFSLNQYGLSMIEVVMAMAMLGAVSLGFMQLQKSSVDMQTEANRNMELMNARNMINSLFYNQDICKATMETLGGALNVRTLGDDSGTYQKITKIQRPNPVTGVNMDMMFTEKGASTPAEEEKVWGKNANRVVLYDARISAYEPEPAGGRRVKNAKIQLEFIFAKRDCANCTDNEREISHFVDLEAQMGTGLAVAGLPAIPNDQVDRCFSAEGDAVLTAMQSLCERMDFDGNGISDYVWDEDTENCIVNPVNPPSYCRYGGAYMPSGPAGKPFSNPLTGTMGCPTDGNDYDIIVSGYYNQATASSCGKKCVRTTNTEYPVYSCVQCERSISATGSSGGSSTSDEGGGCPAFSCGSCQLPYDSDGDDCDDACINDYTNPSCGGGLPSL
ncbi:MAG: hypothetical protein CME62_13075 [Halobacteriovoraceae bacterium]|nr:hypothetical protein [Halobacteriovoraceae bacterium]